MNWRSAFFLGKEREELLDKELRFHLEEQIRENIALGMNPEQARREALLEFGGVDQIKEQCRDVSPATWLDALLQDVKFGFRSLGKSRGFTFTALATIAIGIGFNAAIYSYLDGILFRSEGPEAARLAWIYEAGPGPGAQRLVSTLNYLDLAEHNTVFEAITSHRWGWVTLTGAGLPTQVYCERIGINFNKVFQGTPMLGRLFMEGDDQNGRDHVIVITHAFWQSQFSSDPNIIGRPIKLDGEPYTVIGVLSKGLADSGPAKMTRPLAFSDQERNRGNRWLLVWGKLKPGVTMEQARIQVETLGQRLIQDHPAANAGWKLQMEPAVADRVPATVKQSLYLLMASVGTVLLIACANLANLTLARGAARSREVAVRAALGAGRGRLVRQFLTESMILSTGGGALGVGVAYASLAGLNQLVPSYYIPINKFVEMDGRVLLFILVLAVLTGLVFGLYPALKGSRPDLRHALSQGGLGSSSGRLHQRFRQSLVVFEVALAIVLLFGGGLLLRSFAKLKQVETGFNTANVITGSLPIDTRHFATQDQLTDYLRKIAERMSSLPGAGDAALTSGVPLRGINTVLPFHVAGAKQDSSHSLYCDFKAVTPSYLRVLGLRLLRGRFLNGRDVKGAARVAVVNESTAKLVFGETDPIGQTIILPQISFPPTNGNADAAWEVVGVVANERVGGPRRDFPMPGVYVAVEQSPLPNMSLLVHTVTDPALVERSIPLALTEVNPDQAVSDLRTLDEIKSSLLGKERLDSTLLGIFAGVALLLSALGLYGVLSYSVAQRTREIGIRSALGATSGNILWLTFRSGLVLTGIGLAMGLAGSVGVGRILASMLFKVEQFDPLTLGAIIGIQGVVALLACFFPARRALRVNPIVALRCE